MKNSSAPLPPAMTKPSSMRAVSDAIAASRKELTGHRFLVGLEERAGLEEFRRLLPRLAFFTMAFQDVLRIARQRCTDAELQAMAQSLELGDKGHDDWYLQDLELLNLPVTPVSLFSSEQELGRDVAYTLISHVLQAKFDVTRVALMLSLEATAGEFFTRVVGFAERSGAPPGLKYFSAHHLQAEEAHEVFEHDVQDRLNAIELPAGSEDEVLGAVGLTFRVMTKMADDLATVMWPLKRFDAVGHEHDETAS